MARGLLREADNHRTASRLCAIKSIAYSILDQLDQDLTRKEFAFWLGEEAVELCVKYDVSALSLKLHHVASKMLHGSREDYEEAISYIKVWAQKEIS